MSSASAIHDGPAAPPVLTGREATECANRRLMLTLFAGILVLTTIGVMVSVIGSATMTPKHPALIAASVVAAASEQVSLYVAPAWKPGLGGERHDAFSKTNFYVKVDQQLRLTIDNRDSAAHSIVATDAGVNVVVQPGVHIYTVVVHEAGRFKPVCAYKCDPFSMGHVGYMQGYITAT